MSFAVECRDVKVTAGKRVLLSSCSFNLAYGSALGVLGPNGAGKTTLLGLSNALVLPASGSICCLGQTVTPKNALNLRKRIGYVAQFRAIDPRQPITVFESVLTGTFGRLGLLKRPGAKEKDLAHWALQEVAAEHLAGRPLGQLSGGESQRVALARALTQEPELLLLDEPTASLDWQARREILQLIKNLRSQLSLSIIMVTHELNALSDLCDELLFLKKGSTLWQGSVAEGINTLKLSELYSTHVDVFEHDNKSVVLT